MDFILNQIALLSTKMNYPNQSEKIDPEDDDEITSSFPLWVRATAFLLMPVAAGTIISLANLNLLPSKYCLLQNIETVKSILTT